MYKGSDELWGLGILYKGSDELWGLGILYKGSDELTISRMLCDPQITDLPELIYRLVKGLITWEDVLKKYPLFTGQETTH